MNQSSRPTTLRAKLNHRSRHFRNRPTLSFAALAFVAMLFASSNWLDPAHGLLLSFDVASALFLVTTAVLMAHATPPTMRDRARAQQEGRWVVLSVSMVAALVVIVTLSLELHSGRSGSLFQLVLSAITIVLSWCFFNTMFTLHYAHDYYAAGDLTAPGLAFPGTDTPDYWDFTYFAFVIGMTFQVSDVQITSCTLRRLALLHSVIAFFFNVVIIALTVNIVAGLG